MQIAPKSLRSASWLLCILTLASLARAEVMLRPLRAAAKRGANILPNASFEVLEGDKPAGWTVHLSPDFNVDTQVAHGGKASLRFSKPDADTRFWVSRTIELNQGKPTPLVVSGWSKAENVVGVRGPEYSIWVDIQYKDGTPLWGQRALFDVGTHDWQYSEFAFAVAKPVKVATVSILFRGSYTGTVWFDDVALQEMEVEGGALFDGNPVALTSPLKQTPHKVVARVVTEDGLTLGFGSQGALAELTVKARSVLANTTGGFWVRDVAAEGTWCRPVFATRQVGKAVVLTGEERTTAVRVEARLEPRAGGIDVIASVQDTTSKDRAITLYFVVPLAGNEWVWHDDMVRKLRTEGGAEYKNAQNWPAAGLSSAYPLCSVTNEQLGLSLSVPMDCPRVCRLVCNTSVKALFVAFDLGLTKETLKFPSRAEVRFSLFHHRPEWGFRAALQRYYERYPDFFLQRLRRGGIWMAFADIGKVAGWEDFGFAYDELGGKFTQFDDEHDIASFHYIEPMTYWLAMDRKYPRTYEGALQALTDNEASNKPDLVTWAKATRRCASFTRDGKYNLSIENQSWCDGAVFTLNPDPDIPEDADCPVNKAHLGYTKAWADKNLLQKEGGCLDGIYLDSLPNWGEVRNWRREHWRTVDVPLTFDPETKQPVLLQIFSTWEFSKWVADDVHARGGVMHGNGGCLWPFFPALLDVTGQEMGSVIDDPTMARARALLRNKPYSPLLNTRFDKMGPEIVEDYFNRCLLYCIFPSFFSGTYLQDGKWVNVHYFTDPMFYERDRHLFRKYIPILRRMFDAGWQPVTYARAEPTTVRVERYGPASNGEVLFAVYNTATNAVTARIKADVRAIEPKSVREATALVTGSAIPYQSAGDTIELAVQVGGKTCEVVCLRP